MGIIKMSEVSSVRNRTRPSNFTRSGRFVILSAAIFTPLNLCESLMISQKKIINDGRKIRRRGGAARFEDGRAF